METLDFRRIGGKIGSVFGLQTDQIIPSPDLNQWMSGKKIPDTMTFLGVKQRPPEARIRYRVESRQESALGFVRVDLQLASPLTSP